MTIFRHAPSNTDTPRSSLTRRFAVIMISVMALTQVFMLDFSYADDSLPQDSGSQTAAETAQETTQESGSQTAPAVQPQNQPAAPGSGKLIESNSLPEAEAIAAYGTYHGTNAKKIPVITYHRVVSNAQKKKGKARSSSLYISQSMFRKEMKWLHKKGYRTINCQELCLWYEGKIRLPKKTVLITFDDSRAGLPKYAYPVLKEFDMKGTVFTIGHGVVNNEKGSIKKKDLPRLLAAYPNVEYQSHTYALHKHFSKKGVYARVSKDAAKQKKYFSFDYVAYPYGYSTKAMRKAYKDSGMKLGFAYGSNGYATRKQSRYQIRRIKIYGNGSMSQFTKWFR